jgi:hypothetical protein
LLQRGPMLNVPKDPVYALGSGGMHAEEVRRAATASQAPIVVSAGIATDWVERAFEAAEQYRDWLHTAASAELGLYMHL